MIDDFTRLPKAIPIQNIETRTVARGFIQNWVATFRVPLSMTSDRGAQFTLELWSAICNLLGTELHPTTAYHLQANGLVERSLGDLKAALKCQLSGPNWVEELPWVLLGIRTAPKEDLGSSTAELVYGSLHMVPGDFIPDGQPRPATQELQQQQQRVGDLRPVPTTAHGKEQIRTNVPQSLKQAKFVFVWQGARKGPLQAPYDGPFEVVDQSAKYLTLRLGTQLDNISIDCLKPAYLDESQPTTAAQPPRPGRPLKPFPTQSPLTSQTEHTQTTPNQPTYAEITTR